MSKIKNGGLDQYGAQPFEQQQLRTVGIEGVNVPPDPLYVTPETTTAIIRLADCMARNLGIFCQSKVK